MFKIKKKNKTVKGTKMWGIMRDETDADPICIDFRKEKAIASMDYNYTILVEMEVTKAYTRNPEFVEIEL